MMKRPSEVDMGSSAPMPVATPADIATTLAAIVAGHARDHGTAIAVEDADGALTYAELTRLAGRVGDCVDPFVSPGQPIGILLAPSTDYVAAILGLLARGICYVPLDASFPAARNAEIAARAGMSAVIVDASTAAAMRDTVPDIPRVMMPALDQCDDASFRVTATPDDLAAIFYTSGSTGQPKGVFQSQRAILYEVLRHCWRAGLQRGEGIALIYSPSVSGATRDLYGSLAAGSRLVIADVRAQGLTRAASLFADADVTVLHIIPGLFRAMFSEPITPAAGRLLRRLRLVHLISDRVQQSDVALFRRWFPADCRLCIDLATTETYSYASWYPDHDAAIDRLLVPVGYPRADAPVRLIDVDGTEVAQGELGEIVVSGHALALGYWRDPTMTAERFRPSAVLPGAREFHTGDMGRLLPDGLLEFVGRKDRQTKIRGNTVHLAEIEAVLATYPGVAEAAAILREGAEPAIIAYYVAEAGEAVVPAALIHWCAERLPAPMRPSALIASDALPRLPSGKPDLVALTQADAQRVSDCDAAAEPDGGGVPVSGIAQLVRESWERILGPGSFNAGATFEAAGGDSLKGLNLVGDLERRLDRSIDWEVLDFRTTPAMLIARLMEAIPERGRGGPVLVLCPGIFGGDVVIADFARRASRDFTPIIADYRWGGDWFDGDVDREQLFARIIAAIVDRIGPASMPAVWLLGNSFGGKIAVETARRLMARGIAVDFIGVLDSVPGDPFAARAPAPMARSRVLSMPGAIVQSLSAWLVDGDRHRLARNLLRVIRLLGRAGIEESLRRAIVHRARLTQFRDVPDGPVAGRLTLFLSNELRFDPSLYPYLGWDKLSDAIEVVTMDVAHSTFMHPVNADAMLEQLRVRKAAHTAQSTACAAELHAN